MTRSESIRLHILTGLIVLPLLQVGLWLFWPYQPITDMQSTVLTHRVMTGSLLHVKRSFCLHTDSASVSSRSISAEGGGLTYSYPPSVHATPRGCHTQTYSVPIPDELAPGRYVYRVVLVYQVNPLRQVSVRLEELAFEVVR